MLAIIELFNTGKQAPLGSERCNGVHPACNRAPADVHYGLHNMASVCTEGIHAVSSHRRQIVAIYPVSMA